MKLYLLILSCLLLSCSKYKREKQENIMSASVFEDVLKEIHLLDASFELNKNIKNYDKRITNNYINIYKKNKITKSLFENTLNYYGENPENLENIYTNILKKLNHEKSNFDLKYTIQHIYLSYLQ